MSDDLKYICFSTVNSEARHFLIFDALQQHSDVAKRALYVLNGGMFGGTVHSAGFAYFDLDYESEETVVQVYGRSSSLKLDCDPAMGDVITEVILEKGMHFVTFKRNGMHYFTSYSPDIDLVTLKTQWGDDLFSEGRITVDVSVIGPLTVKHRKSSLGDDKAAIQAEDTLILRALQGDSICRA